jgi:uncharacterized membrane protein
MLSDANRMVRVLLDAPRRLLVTIVEVLTSPTLFAVTKIDTGPGCVRRALVFYFNIFGALFVLLTLCEHFYFYTGQTESRTAARLALQVIMAVAILAVVNRVWLKQNRPTISGILQCILYADAVYLIFITILSVAIGYVIHRIAGTTSEIDIINTEWERCVSSQSYLYWLTRGDLTWLRQPSPNIAIERLLAVAQYSEFLVIIPFCHIFSRMMASRYKTNYALNFVGGILTFIVVETSTIYATENLQNSLSRQSNCNVRTMTAALAKYSRPMLARQLVVRINAEASSITEKKWTDLFKFEDDAVVMKFKYKPTGDQFRLAANDFASLMTDWYCDVSTELSRAQFIDMPLRLVLTWGDGSEILSTIEPKLCYQRPVFSLGRKLADSLPTSAF